MKKVLVLEKKMNCNLKTSKLLAYWRFLAHTAEKIGGIFPLAFKNFVGAAGHDSGGRYL